MSKYACVQPNGIVAYTATLSDNDHIPQNPTDGSVFVAVAQDTQDSVLINSYYNFEKNTFFALPEKLNEFYDFDYVTKDWVLNSEKLSANIRQQRDSLLFQSDWTQTLDAPLTEEKRAEWALYRQKLRDISLQDEFPLNIVWATPPSN
jgi:hypothetical protein